MTNLVNFLKIVGYGILNLIIAICTFCGGITAAFIFGKVAEIQGYNAILWFFIALICLAVCIFGIIVMGMVFCKGRTILKEIVNFEKDKYVEQ